MTRRFTVLSLTFLLVALTFSDSLAVRKQPATLPPAADSAFKAAFPGATIKQVDQESEQGVTVFGVEFKVGGAERDCDITPDGTIVEVSTEIEAKDLPPAVRTAFDGVKGTAKLQEFERVEVRARVDSGQVTPLPKPELQFEAELVDGRRHGSVTASAEGKIVEGPTWRDKTEAGD